MLTLIAFSADKEDSVIRSNILMSVIYVKAVKDSI